MRESIEQVFLNLKSTDGALGLQHSQGKIDSIFRELAVRDTAGIGDSVAGMLASKIEEVKRLHPELTNTEAYIVAARLLKQLIACYQSALNQLLP
jgi:hypothetical protein